LWSELNKTSNLLTESIAHRPKDIHNLSKELLEEGMDDDLVPKPLDQIEDLEDFEYDDIDEEIDDETDKGK
jgi:hypothetical protein